MLEKLNTCKDYLVTCLASCGLFVFTFFVFGPLELYITNMHNTMWFWFTLSDLLPILIVGPLAFVLLVLITSVLPETPGYMVVAVAFGIGLALYIQGNFMPINYGPLDGTSVDWNQYRVWAVINTLIWVSLITTPVYICILKRTFFKKVVKILSLFIIVVQIATLVLLFATKALPKTTDHTLTYEGLYTVSDNKNIIVFVLDTFDAQFMNEILDEYPDVKNEFKDFTYYNNTIGMYPTTRAAMPYILTGQKYKNEIPFQRHLKDAYSISPLYNTLKVANYDVGIYSYAPFISTDMIDRVNNMVLSRPTISSYKEFAFLYYRFTSIKYFPHIIKKYVWISSMLFNNLKENSREDILSYDPYTSDMEIYSALVESGLSVQSKPVFRIIHLWAAHYPYNYNESVVESDETTTTPLQKARGSLKIVLEYIARLKEINAYDNTMMIIMADHGCFEFSSNPTLLFKDFDTSEPFQISEVPISYEDLMPTLISAITGDQQHGTTIPQIPLGEKRYREFLYYYGGGSWDTDYLPEIHEYYTFGKANDISGYIRSATMYSEGASRKSGAYNLGTIVKAISLDRYFNGGLSELIVDTYRWSKKEFAELGFNLNRVPQKDLLLVLNIAAVYGGRNGSQRIRLYANAQYVGEKTVMPEDAKIEMIIPKNMLDGTELKLRLEYPDAISPHEVDSTSGDTRILAFAFESICITEGAYQDYILDTVVTVENLSSYFLNGIGPLDGKSRWSTGDYSELGFDLNRVPKKDLLLEFDFASVYGGKNGSQRLNLYVNDQFAGEKRVATDESKIEMVIPKDMLDGTELKLRLEYPDAISPHEVDSTSGDTRVLAFAFESLCISKRK